MEFRKKGQGMNEYVTEWAGRDLKGIEKAAQDGKVKKERCKILKEGEIRGRRKKQRPNGCKRAGGCLGRRLRSKSDCTGKIKKG